MHFCFIFFFQNKYLKITLVCHIWLKVIVLGQTWYDVNTFYTLNELLDANLILRPFSYKCFFLFVIFLDKLL